MIKFGKKVTKLYNDWKTLEYEEGRGSDRSKNFENKEQLYKETLLDPMVIHKQNPDEILKRSVIKEWKQDLQHLYNQMKRTQIGTALGEDRAQKIRNITRKRRQSSTSRLKSKQETAGQGSSTIQLTSSSSGEERDSSSSDNDWGKSKGEPLSKKVKIDVMSSTASTAD